MTCRKFTKRKHSQMFSGGRYRDRHEAGQLLGRELARRLGKKDDLIVLALPRGGVPVGHDVAKAIDAPLDVFIVRKLGVPGHEELAMGAIASGGVRVLNDDVLRQIPLPPAAIDAVAQREQRELERRERTYRGNRPPLDVAGRTVIVGVASHGRRELYRARAEITQRLIAEKGFEAVAVEADWPDAYRVNRFVRDLSDDAESVEALGDFKRFPTWMWRNADVLDFVGWLRDFGGAVGFYGVDLYSLFTSIEKVIAVLDEL